MPRNASEPHLSRSADIVEDLLYSLEKGLLTNADKQEIARLLRGAAQPAPVSPALTANGVCLNCGTDESFGCDCNEVAGVQPLAAPVETDVPAWHGVQDAIDAWAQKTLGEDAGAIMSWSDRLAQHLEKQLAYERKKYDPNSPGHTDLMLTPESIDAFLEASPPPHECSPAGCEPVAWRVKNDFGHWYVTQDKALADTYRDVEKKDVQPLYLAAQPPAAPVQAEKVTADDLRAVYDAFRASDPDAKWMSPTACMIRATLNRYDVVPKGACQSLAAPVAAPDIEDVADIIRDKVYADENDKVGGVYDAAQKVIEYITAFAAQPPTAPVETEELLSRLVDWAYLHALEGEAWPSTATKQMLIARARQDKPTQDHADGMKAVTPQRSSVAPVETAR